MKMKTLYAALSGAILLSAATLSTAADTPSTVTKAKEATTKQVDKAIDATPPARTMSRADYSSQKESIEADFKAAKEKCKPMTGNAKDVCHAEAKADEKIRKADLEAKYKGTPGAEYDAKVAKAKAQYEVAKEKCDDKTGADKTACKKQAKADESKAIAEAKATKKVASAPVTK